MVEENFFNQSQQAFKLVQIWPFRDGDSKYVRLFKVMVPMAMGISLIIIYLSETIEEIRHGEISDALSKALLFLPLTVCTQKMGSAALFKTEIYGCIKQMEILSKRFKNTTKIEKCLGLYKKLFLLGISFTILCDVSFVMAPLTTGAYRPLPFTPCLPFLHADETPNWQFIYIFEILSLGVITVAAISYDTLFCGMMCVSSGILSSLSREIRQLDDIIEDHPTLETKMKEIIDKLIEVTQLTSIVSDNFSITTMTHMLYDCNSLAFGLFMITVLPLGLSLFSVIMIVVLVTFQLWIYCYFGQVIVTERENLRRELYFTRWYDGSKNYKTMLLLTIFETQNDRYVYAGKVIPLSLETFTQVIKRAYVFFTFLNESR